MVKALNRKTTAESPKKRIFLVEDHPVFRDGLANLVNAEHDLMVCGEAGDADEGFKSVSELKPDLAVVDLGLPGKSGLELIKEIRGAGLPTKLLVVSMFDEGLYAQRVLRAGGDGYVMKQEDPSEIINAIRDVLAGHIYVSEEVFESGAVASEPERQENPLDRLSDSELEVLEALGQGKSPKEISSRAGLSAGDVNAHCKSMRGKLGLKNTNALIHYAVCWVKDARK
jgi:DNA-binding NarL/FixJ family response regulator